MKQAHNHLITIDQESRCIRIFRVMSNGEHQPYAMLAIPGNGSDKKRLQMFAQMLGEDILVDSPVTQPLFG
ncbi:hypothetical protein GCM10011408_25890 [Dyella caseinilytica]|nr:hypothetical protein GCM10011408_25890 [Dyella caseinilytica]